MVNQIEILSQFDGPVTFNNNVKINDDLFVTGTVKFTGPLEFSADQNEFKKDVLFQANAKFQDNKKILIGNGSSSTDTTVGDCEVYHDGNNTKIDQVASGTGRLLVQNSGSTRVEVNPFGTVLSGITTITDLRTTGSSLSGITTIGITTATSTVKLTPAITAKNTGGSPVGGVIQRWSGNVGTPASSLEIRNNGVDGGPGDYEIVNTGSNHKITMYGGDLAAGGIRFATTSDGAAGFRMDIRDTVVRIGGPNAVELQVSDEITAFASDIRLKTDIEPIDNALDKVCKISGFTYKHNEVAKLKCDLDTGDQRYVGVSAQDIQQVLPEAVRPAPSNNDYLTVQYEKLVPLLIEAIKELKNEIDELKKSK